MNQLIHSSNFEPNTEGVFELDESVYHDYSLSPAVNRGAVIKLLTLTPAHVKVMIDGSVKKPPTKPMIAGSLIDKALLEPWKFKEGVSHWVRPSELDMRTKDGIQWRKDHPDLPDIPDKSDQPNVVSSQDIQGVIDSVMKHRQARAIIEQSIKQESAFKYDGDTGLLRKCRPDARMVDRSSRIVLGDLKTIFPGGTSDASISNHCARMGYHIQDAYYGDIYKDLTGEKPFFVFFVVERKPPYAVRVFQIHEEGREVAREKYKRALEIYKQCQDSNDWPAHRQEIEIIRLPKWELNTPDPVVIG